MQRLKNRRMRLQVTGKSPLFSVQSTKFAVNWHKVRPAKSRLILVKIFIWLALSIVAHAQTDPATSVLLNPGVPSSAEPTLDSSRFKVRVPESRKDDDLEEVPGTFIPSPVPRARDTKAAKKSIEPTNRAEKALEGTDSDKAAGGSEKSTGKFTGKPIEGSVEKPNVEPPSAAPQEEIVRPAPPVTTQVRDLILGGRDEDIVEYRARIHPEDPRNNILGITLAPAYYYMDSSSQYSFRDYNSNGPGFGLGMNVWLTPFLGIQSRYFSSVASGVRDGGVNVVGMDTQEFEAGVRFRKHFGYSLRSPQLSWGIDYHDSNNKISPEATSVVGRKSSGLSLALDATIPSTVRYAATFDVAIRPYQQHAESHTAANGKSGNKSQSHGVSFGVGGQWTLDRRNQIFWRGQYSVERNLFNGDAIGADANGNTPNGVSVTNSLMIFYFGFKWGS